MHSKINDILKEIKSKKEELFKEYDKLKEKYGFKIEKGRIKFTLEKIKENSKLKLSIRRTIFGFKGLLSAPFIYGMVFPAIILDFALFIYQQATFRIYGIPLVKRKEYIVYDRKFLDYLNWHQKINCLYCSYVNGLFSYAVEIAGRTEKFWCPIKSASKLKGGHYWQNHFADYGDPEGFLEEYHNNKCFYKED